MVKSGKHKLLDRKHSCSSALRAPSPPRGEGNKGHIRLLAGFKEGLEVVVEAVGGLDVEHVADVGVFVIDASGDALVKFLR